MKQPIYLASIVAALALTTTACTPSSEVEPVSTPTPSAVTTPAPRPAPVVQEVRYDNYLDAPQTEGDWRIALVPNKTKAVFETPNGREFFMVECDRTQRSVLIFRSSMERGTDRLIGIRTETGSRNLTAKAWGNGFGATVGVDDPILDAMAITKGRIAVEVEGMRTLYIPAWPEMSRAIEDCR